MRRRRTLQLLGAGLLGGLAGCTGDDAEPSGTARSTDVLDTLTPEPRSAPFEHPGTLETTFATNGDYPADENPADGYPPEFTDSPAPPDVDPSSFETKVVSGESVPLAPIDVVIDWYRRGEARFVDARSLESSEIAHIYGSVASNAQRRATGGGIDGWPTDDRVITYCGCPHHLSSLRAAGLKQAGFERVYAIDEGVGEWDERDYPLAGTEWIGDTRTERADATLRGVVDPAHAGKYAWATASDYEEAGRIRDDGSYAIHIRFAGVDGTTPVTVTTPTYTVTGALGDLAEGRIRPT